MVPCTCQLALTLLAVFVEGVRIDQEELNGWLDSLGRKHIVDEASAHPVGQILAGSSSFSPSEDTVGSAAAQPVILNKAATEEIIIVGAGIAGLAAAILLARDHGFKVTVYESATDLSQKLEESYPIGVNPRGLRTLDAINPALRTEIELAGMIDGWSINSNGREVAALASGVVAATTRGTVVAALYKEAMGMDDNVLFRMGHKLQTFDAASSTLSFLASGKDVIVNASQVRILDGTGCWSKIRKGLAEMDSEFKVETYAWGTVFRNLFTADEPPQSTLKSTWHYIFSTKMSGIYGAVLSGKRWVFSLGCDAENPWLLETTPTQENIDHLKAYVEDICPPAAAMLEDQEYERFFSRRSFTGQVVKVSRLNQREQIVLLGDSAHAVLPATGEGTNAALEDVSVLVDALVSSREASSGWFEMYNTQRLPDAHALSDYARYLAEAAHIDPASKNRRTANMICVQIARKVGIFGPTWNELTFGPAAALCTPYRDAYASWQSQSSKVRGISNFFAWFANRNLPPATAGEQQS